MKIYYTGISMLLLICAFRPSVSQEVQVWHMHEIALESEKSYGNPLYDVEVFYAEVESPSGKISRLNGFWDGGTDWKIRIMPDEPGTWSYRTVCSDEENSGLHRRKGEFECIGNTSDLAIYRKGALRLDPDSYHFRYSDGTPFFWQACTAWNGGLKSTPEEWDHYLSQRSGYGYNVIQMVVTQWRGCERDSRGEVAFTGCGRITLNPGFFRRMDRKVDEVNRHGHVAALVLLWALPFGAGTEFSPGYYLPDREAIKLARYLVARYQGYHVTWVLGGDGRYYGELEDRWKHIGEEVFRDDPPGLVTLHPHGISWIGELYDKEDWFDYVGYQSTHGTSARHVNFINRTVADGWKDITPKPVINMEPCYEQIRNEIFADDVRRASYWSLFAAPPAGITYGHDGTWPWLREGEKPDNHRYTPEVDTWDVGIELPGSKQVSFLGNFFRQLEWWNLVPDHRLVADQPGDTDYTKYVSVLRSRDLKTILVYFPGNLEASVYLPGRYTYRASWFDPVDNRYRQATPQYRGRRMEAGNPFGHDAVLVLTAVDAG